MQVHLDGVPIDLPPDRFVATGGEATVYALEGLAYKVFHGPIDGARLRALARLSVPGAVLPQSLLTDAQGCVIGHTMALVSPATPLARLMSRRFCLEQGYDMQTRMQVVLRLADRIHALYLTCIWL